MKNWIRLIVQAIAAFLLIGLLYSITGYLYRASIGRPAVFHPLVGVPLEMLGWPYILRGMLLQGDWNPQGFVALGALVIAIGFLFRSALQLFSQRKAAH